MEADFEAREANTTVPPVFLCAVGDHSMKVLGWMTPG